MIALDAKALSYALSGEPITCTAGAGWTPDDGPDGPDDAMNLAAALYERVQATGWNESLENLAEELCCAEEEAPPHADLPDAEINLNFAEHELASLRAGHTAIDLDSYHQAAAGERMFGPLEMRRIKAGNLAVDADDLPLKQELLERYRLPGRSAGPVPAPPGKGSPPDRLRQELVTGSRE
jgi:hypothetical protein